MGLIRFIGFVVLNNFIKGGGDGLQQIDLPRLLLHSHLCRHYYFCRCALHFMSLRKGIEMVFIQTMSRRQTPMRARRIRIVYYMRHFVWVQQLLAPWLHGIPFPNWEQVVFIQNSFIHSDSGWTWTRHTDATFLHLLLLHPPTIDSLFNPPKHDHHHQQHQQCRDGGAEFRCCPHLCIQLQ